MNISLGSLHDRLKGYAEGAALLMDSAGPVSDAFILSRGTRDLLSGPVGSGKTTACVKRGLVSAICLPPMRDGWRHYRLAVFRQTYDQLWLSTIKSFCKVLDPNKGIGILRGSPPRPAQYLLEFEDAFGPIRFEVLFRAFGEDADPDDLGGTEFTDAYLNEMNTLREELFINIARSLGRFPNRGEIGLPDDARVPHGRLFGDCNAPAPDNWVFRDFWSPDKPPGYRHFRQPGGLAPDAENLRAVGRTYYEQMVRDNRHRPWWVKIKVHHRPGYNQDVDVVYEKFDDDTQVSFLPLDVFPNLPVLVGIDGGLTPAAVFMQEGPDGQVRILDEVSIARGDELDLARGMLAVMGRPRYRGCEFRLRCDPAMGAGEGLGSESERVGSMRQRLEKLLALRVELAPSNDPETRHRPLREAIERGARGLQVDGTHCPIMRRGFNGTYHYRRTNGTNDRSGVVKNPDSHTLEAAEYAASMLGTEAARIRRSDRQREREHRRAKGSGATYRPAFRRSR